MRCPPDLAIPDTFDLRVNSASAVGILTLQWTLRSPEFLSLATNLKKRCSSRLLPGRIGRPMDTQEYQERLAEQGEQAAVPGAK